jgi:tripeptidyl-peptidase I
VSSWLAENGITDFEVGGAYDDWIWFKSNASDANTLLEANYRKFVHSNSGKELVRTLEYSLPVDLFDHIRVVHPTTGFSGSLGQDSQVLSTPIILDGIKRRAEPPTAPCSSRTTPACLQSMYGIPSEPATQASNRLAVSGFIGQHARVCMDKTVFRS